MGTGNRKAWAVLRPGGKSQSPSSPNATRALQGSKSVSTGLFNSPLMTVNFFQPAIDSNGMCIHTQ